MLVFQIVLYRKHSQWNKLAYEKIPDRLILQGFGKDFMLATINFYICNEKANSIELDEDMKATLEKVHYACLYGTEIRKELVVKVNPQFRMEINKPYEEIDMNQSIIKHAMDESERMRTEQSRKRNKDFYNA